MGMFDFFRSKSEPSAALTTVSQAPIASPALPSRSRLSAFTGAVKRMFMASGEVGRLTGDWSTQPMPAEWVVAKHQRALVARSRQQAVDNDFMKAYLRLVRQNIVGASGIMFQSKAKLRNGKADKSAQPAIERAFCDWGKRQHCDVAGKLSWRALKAACVETAARDGEFFLRMVTGRSAGKYGFALQVIDPQRCPVDFDEFGRRDGSFIRSGIEFNAYGRAVAYWFHDDNSKSHVQGYIYAGRPNIRIPADEIVHGFVSEMVGQKRGLPWLSTGLFRMKQMGAFEDAAVVNARIGAAKMGFIKYREGTGPEPNDAPLEIDTEAGAMIELPEGAEFDKFDPTYPSGEFAVFMKQMLRSLSAGGGVSYHELSQDLEGVNFSSIRQGTLDAREFYMERQEWLIEELCEVVFENWLPRALLAGIKADNGRPLPAENLERYAEHYWQPRRWSWIDPRADVEANVAAKNNMLKSPGRIIREGGEDPETVFAEIASDIEAMKAAGIPDNIIEAAFALKIAPPAKPAPEGSPDQ